MSHGWRSGGPAETRAALWWRWTIVVAVWRTDSILFYVLKIANIIITIPLTTQVRGVQVPPLIGNAWQNIE